MVQVIFGRPHKGHFPLLEGPLSKKRNLECGSTSSRNDIRTAPVSGLWYLILLIDQIVSLILIPDDTNLTYSGNDINTIQFHLNEDYTTLQ